MQEITLKLQADSMLYNNTRSHVELDVKSFNKYHHSKATEDLTDCNWLQHSWLHAFNTIQEWTAKLNRCWIEAFVTENAYVGTLAKS